MQKRPLDRFLLATGLAVCLGMAGPALAQGTNNRPDPNQQADRGAGPDHNLRRGQMLPVQYRRGMYIVNDWRRHLLPAPPPGHYWVQLAGDYLLITGGTGRIVDMILVP